ncbi:GNAT family N-acetyltransferase, partial [Vibrio alginolyticus]|nr:GNAT family N-acetyltransferase [Vibrio alginolyticus]
QPALSLYQSMGFTVLEEVANYFGDEESRLVMEFVK